MNHEIPVRIVDNQEYMKVVRSILEEGKEVPLVVTGNSMMPFLIDRRDQVLIKRIERPLKKVDITTSKIVLKYILEKSIVSIAR